MFTEKAFLNYCLHVSCKHFNCNNFYDKQVYNHYLQTYRTLDQILNYENPFLLILQVFQDYHRMRQGIFCINNHF